jgi:uncharacterized protein YkwD
MAALMMTGACGESPSSSEELAGPPVEALANAASWLTLSEGLDAEERAFLVAINQHRAQNGLPSLQVSVALSKAADHHSQQMADHNYFSHTLLNGVTWNQNICNFGYCYNTTMAENIAAGNAAGNATFTQWKNSPGHNTNMLGANFKVIGIGRAYNANSTYKWYWTTTFGGFVDEVMTAEGSGGTGEPGAPPSGGGSSSGGASGTPTEQTVSGSVARRESRHHGPFAVLPGTSLRVVMTGSGDPDLYVRFGAQPTLSSFDCRPYRNGPNETCSLQVPAGQSQAFVMVNGYAASEYSLALSYTAP